MTTMQVCFTAATVISAVSFSTPLHGHVTLLLRMAFLRCLCALRQKIKEIEDEMARTQKNKATSGHLGMLKVRLCSAVLLQQPSSSTPFFRVCKAVDHLGQATCLRQQLSTLLLQAKLAKLRRELLEPSSGGGAGAGKGEGPALPPSLGRCLRLADASALLISCTPEHCRVQPYVLVSRQKKSALVPVACLLLFLVVCGGAGA